MLRDLFSLFPAYAGVILARTYMFVLLASFPRICGGDPEKRGMKPPISAFSPHTRG